MFNKSAVPSSFSRFARRLNLYLFFPSVLSVLARSVSLRKRPTRLSKSAIAFSHPERHVAAAFEEEEEGGGGTIDTTDENSAADDDSGYGVEDVSCKKSLHLFVSISLPNILLQSHSRRDEAAVHTVLVGTLV